MISCKFGMLLSNAEFDRLLASQVNRCVYYDKSIMNEFTLIFLFLCKYFVNITTNSKLDGWPFRHLQSN